MKSAYIFAIGTSLVAAAPVLKGFSHVRGIANADADAVLVGFDRIRARQLESVSGVLAPVYGVAGGLLGGGGAGGFVPGAGGLTSGVGDLTPVASGLVPGREGGQTSRGGGQVHPIEESEEEYPTEESEEEYPTEKPDKEYPAGIYHERRQLGGGAGGLLGPVTGALSPVLGLLGGLGGAGGAASAQSAASPEAPTKSDVSGGSYQAEDKQQTPTYASTFGAVQGSTQAHAAAAPASFAQDSQQKGGIPACASTVPQGPEGQPAAQFSPLSTHEGSVAAKAVTDEQAARHSEQQSQEASAAAGEASAEHETKAIGLAREQASTQGQAGVQAHPGEAASDKTEPDTYRIDDLLTTYGVHK